MAAPAIEPRKDSIKKFESANNDYNFGFGDISAGEAAESASSIGSRE